MRLTNPMQRILDLIEQRPGLNFEHEGRRVLIFDDNEGPWMSYTTGSVMDALAEADIVPFNLSLDGSGKRFADLDALNEKLANR